MLNLENIQANDSISTAFLTKINGNMQKLDEAYSTLANTLLQKTGKETIVEALNYIDNLVNAQDGTITADKVFNGYTGYAGTNKIVGTALSTTSTGTASNVLKNKTLYNSNGALVTGTMQDFSGITKDAPTASKSGTNYQVKIPSSGYYSSSNSYIKRSVANVLNDLNVVNLPVINVTLESGTASAATTYISGYGAGIDRNGNLVIWAMGKSTYWEHIKFVDTEIGAGTIDKGWNVYQAGTNGNANIPYACTVAGLNGYSTINIALVATADSTYDYVQLDVTLTAE